MGKPFYIGLFSLIIVVLITGAVSVQEDSTASSEESVVGWCSYVSSVLHGTPTASGEVYDETELTAAHRSYPFGTRLRVTNLSNDEEVVVRVNDRGPYRPNRILDVSLRAARELEFVEEGVTKVEIRVLGRE